MLRVPIVLPHLPAVERRIAASKDQRQAIHMNGISLIRNRDATSASSAETLVSRQMVLECGSVYSSEFKRWQQV